jgi:2'-5' RNA ligase
MNGRAGKETDMSATDRLFFAIFPPAATAARIYALQQDLRVRHGLWGRALAMDRLHVTLSHLGDYVGLPPAIVAKAHEAASRVRAPAIDISFDRALSFAGRERNRPFVLRNSEGASVVQAFQRELGKAMALSGLGKFVRPYTPHMTLLYDSNDISEQSIDPVTWQCTEFRLIHSMLGQTRHVTLGAWQLGESAVVTTPLLAAE